MDIKFATNTTFQGRNGTGTCKGIVMSPLGETLWLAPITSRGKVGNCGIEIPMDNIPTLCKALKEAQKNSKS